MSVHPTLQMFSRFNSHQLKKPYRECALFIGRFSWLKESWDEEIYAPLARQSYFGRAWLKLKLQIAEDVSNHSIKKK
jgi:hypothetical protein